MISNAALTNALRSLNFTFKRQTDRVMIWKQRGTTLRVSVRRHSTHDNEYSAVVLRQAGMSEEEIAAFIGCTSNAH